MKYNPKDPHWVLETPQCAVTSGILTDMISCAKIVFSKSEYQKIYQKAVELGEVSFCTSYLDESILSNDMTIEEAKDLLSNTVKYDPQKAKFYAP